MNDFSRVILYEQRLDFLINEQREIQYISCNAYICIY